MKKTWNTSAALAALALAMGMLTACGGEADTSTGSSTAAPPIVSVISSPAPASSPPDSVPASTPAPAAALTDTEVRCDGVAIAPGADATPVLEALGEPLEYSEVISCMFESGMDKTYVYEGLTLYTYPTATQELVLLIDVTSPDVETGRGVKVGDSLDAALLAYTDVIAPETETRYTATFGEVFFSIVAQDGVVKSMTYELDKTPIS